MPDADILEPPSAQPARAAAAAPLTQSWWPADTSVELSDLTVGELLVARATAHPDRLALVATSHSGEQLRLTYADLLERSRRVASGLLEVAEPGEFVALWAPNVAEWPIVQYGAALAGVVLVALNPVLRGEELRYALDHSGAVALIHADTSRDYDLAAVVAEVAPTCPSVRTVVSLSDVDRLAGAPARESLPTVRQLDPVMLQYTSGTTGTPKGVLLHHRALVNNAMLTLESTGVAAGAVCVNPLPMFHTAACVISTLGPLWIGGTMVLLQQFTPAAALAAVRDEGATVHMAVPTVLGALLEAAKAGGEPAPHLDQVLVGAANVPRTMIEAVEEVFGASVHNLFGQTELAPVITCIRPGDTRSDQVSSVGRPLPQAEVKIVDPATGEVAPLGTSGEICARSYQQLIEYYRDPEATAAAVDADGWLHMGDLGAMDERGVLTLTGRLKELIIRGGENIAPGSVENVLVTHRAVLDAAVVGVPDDTWGEVVVAAVRLREALEDPQAELTAFCRERLAPYMVPVRFEVVTDYPMTASGKVQKFRLREQLQRQGD
ncbi:MAG: fadK 2 [Frankiales bacterium]|nr:fadK 2 [Frankiales bacterium]